MVQLEVVGQLCGAVGGLAVKVDAQVDLELAPAAL